ncbi:MAG: ATP-binding protein, partial [Verrucomicrobium sp.]
SATAKREQDEFMQHCILASLMEGILVVDGQGVITLVNAEFIHMFQLTQSPLQRPVDEVVRDKKLQGLISDALSTGRVQSARVTRPSSSEVGRPPALEVSAVPIHLQMNKVGGAIVLFLPPPDRTRVIQSMKRHSQRLENLVGELMLAGPGTQDLLPQKRATVLITELLEDAVASFNSRTENQAIKTSWRVEPDHMAVSGDAGSLEVVLTQLLVNLAADLAPVSEIQIQAQVMDGKAEIAVVFTGGALPEAELQRAFGSPFSRHGDDRLPIIGVGSGLSMVREVITHHAGNISASSTSPTTTTVTLRLPLASASTQVTESATRTVVA